MDKVMDLAPTGEHSAGVAVDALVAHHADNRRTVEDSE